MTPVAVRGPAHQRFISHVCSGLIVELPFPGSLLSPYCMAFLAGLKNTAVMNNRPREYAAVEARVERPGYIDTAFGNLPAIPNPAWLFFPQLGRVRSGIFAFRKSPLCCALTFFRDPCSDAVSPGQPPAKFHIATAAPENHRNPSPKRTDLRLDLFAGRELCDFSGSHPDNVVKLGHHQNYGSVTPRICSFYLGVYVFVRLCPDMLEPRFIVGATLLTSASCSCMSPISSCFRRLYRCDRYFSLRSATRRYQRVFNVAGPGRHRLVENSSHGLAA